MSATTPREYQAYALEHKRTIEIGKDSPDRMMSVLKARCIARYKLHTVPGRPEELIRNLRPVAEIPQSTEPIGIAAVLDRTISFGYLHGQVRIRKHGGQGNRQWIDTRDIIFKDGWLSEVYDYLDPFFGYVDPTSIIRPLARPIRDSPQA